MVKQQKILAVMAVVSLLAALGVWLAPRLWAQTVAFPDLTVDQTRLQSSIVFRTQVFKSTDCAVVEGCVTGSGKRTLMKFDVAIPNIGTADLFLGSPTDPSRRGWIFRA